MHDGPKALFTWLNDPLVSRQRRMLRRMSTEYAARMLELNAREKAVSAKWRQELADVKTKHDAQQEACEDEKLGDLIAEQGAEIYDMNVARHTEYQGVKLARTHEVYELTLKHAAEYNAVFGNQAHPSVTN